jgi:hypothetical protein
MHAVRYVDTSMKRTQTKRVTIILQNHKPGLQTATVVAKNFWLRLLLEQEVSMRVNQDKAFCHTYSAGMNGVDLRVFHIAITVRLLADLPTSLSLTRLIKQMVTCTITFNIQMVA